MSRKHPDRYLMRSATSVIVFWFAAAALLVVVGIPLVQANWRVLAFLLSPSLLLAWVFWIVLYRPAVWYDPAKAVVVNMGRTHVLPWGHVTNVRQGIGMRFDLDTGKAIMASGVPAPGRSGIIGSSIDRRTRPTHDLNRDADILDGVRRAAQSDAEPIRSRWDVIPLVIGAVLAIAVIIEFVVGL